MKYSEIGSVSHVFYYFTIKFHFSFFASFRLFSLQIFLHLSHFRFEVKQSEAKFKSIFSFFCFFLLFSLFFVFFHFFCFFFTFFAFFHFFCFFSLNFRFASIFSLNVCLFYLRFRFRFLVFCIEVNHVKSGFFSLPSKTKFSLQFQISLPKRKWGRTLILYFWLVEIRRFCCSHVCRQSDGCVLFSILEVILPYITIMASNK